MGDASLDSTYYNNPISNLTNSWSYPLGYGWGLHKGLNLSVDLSAFATFGKNVPHRGGFTQTIDATYLTPLTKDNKLWLALGTYINNVNYGGDSYHDGGVYGILGYQFNEHWEAYVYGQLSVANNYNLSTAVMAVMAMVPTAIRHGATECILGEWKRNHAGWLRNGSTWRQRFRSRCKIH